MEAPPPRDGLRTKMTVAVDSHSLVPEWHFSKLVVGDELDNQRDTRTIVIPNDAAKRHLLPFARSSDPICGSQCAEVLGTPSNCGYDFPGDHGRRPSGAGD